MKYADFMGNEREDGRSKDRVSYRKPLDLNVKPLEVDALVDTGAVVPLLGKDIVDRLGAQITRRAVVTLADDTSLVMDVAGPIIVEIGDRRSYFECLVAPVLAEPLMGQVVLEVLDLVVAPGKRTLAPRPESPAYPSYKLK
nr:clan AA aspartic protease [Gammaproteobacteria bacterium]